MNKNKHLTRLDRDIIKSMLDDKNNFTQISAAIGKDRTTVLERCSKNSVSYGIFLHSNNNTPHLYVPMMIFAVIVMILHPTKEIIVQSDSNSTQFSSLPFYKHYANYGAFFVIWLQSNFQISLHHF